MMAKRGNKKMKNQMVLWQRSRRPAKRKQPSLMTFLAKFILKEPEPIPINEDYEIKITEVRIKKLIRKQSSKNADVIDVKAVEIPRPDDEFIFLTEASETYHVNPDTLRQLCRDKEIKAKKEHNRWIIHTASLREHLNKIGAYA